MPSLLKIFARGSDKPVIQGELYPAVRDAMVDVQAYARSHGGEIQLIGVGADGQVQIKFRGACSGCPMSGLTLRMGVEEQLRKLVPGVSKVIQVR